MNRSGMSVTEMMKKRMGQLAKLHDTGEGRTLEELKKTNEVLRGQESLRLRTFCTSNRMEPRRDLDLFGQMLLRGNFEMALMDYHARMQEKLKSMELEPTKAAIVKDLCALRWGPTAVGLYNLLGLFSQIVPVLREEYLSIAQFYIEAGIPVDGRDVSGTTALSHCFSTKPSFDLEYAQFLYDAGGDVNARNRYGTQSLTKSFKSITPLTQRSFGKLSIHWSGSLATAETLTLPMEMERLRVNCVISWPPLYRISNVWQTKKMSDEG